MTAKHKITTALAAKGYTVEAIEYIRPDGPYEMIGMCGGWEIDVSPPISGYYESDEPGMAWANEHEVMGINSASVLEVIAKIPLFASVETN